MPEHEMHTTACWLTFPRELMAGAPVRARRAARRRRGAVLTLGQMAALF
jgi:hypothetical protein